MIIIISAFGYKGKEFVFGFIRNANIDNSRIQVFVVNDNTYQVTATLDGATGRIDTLTIPAASTRDIIIPTHMHYLYVSVDTGVTNKGMMLAADGDVSVFLLNGREYIMDGTLVYLTRILTGHYTALSWYAPNNINAQRAELLIVGHQNNTSISVTLSALQGYALTIGGVSYNPGNTVNLTLGMYDAYLIKCTSCDISRYVVTSSKPVALFSGNGQTTTGTTRFRDQLFQQAAPIETWGKLFVLFGMSNHLYGPNVRILTHDDRTTISFKDGKTDQAAFIGQRNTVYNIKMNSDRCAILKSDRPILVALFFRGCKGLGIKCDPSMFYIPPLEKMTSPPWWFQRPDLVSMTLCLVIIAGLILKYGRPCIKNIRLIRRTWLCKCVTWRTNLSYRVIVPSHSLLEASLEASDKER